MSNGSQTDRLELPPEAEPALDFIDAIVAKFTKEIDELKAEVADLKEASRKLLKVEKWSPEGDDVALRN